MGMFASERTSELEENFLWVSLTGGYYNNCYRYLWVSLLISFLTVVTGLCLNWASRMLYVSCMFGLGGGLNIDICGEGRIKIPVL